MRPPRASYITAFKVLVGLFTLLCAASVQAGDKTPRADDHMLRMAGPRQPIVAPVVERRYMVEAINFKCIDEWGYDEPFFAPWISDEVVVLIRDPPRRVITLSRVFDDVDAGESYSFGANQSCVLPIAGLSDQSDNLLQGRLNAWQCRDAGIPGPFSFTVEMYEEDSGFWHDCFTGERGCDFSSVAGYPGSNDELIGKRTLQFTPEELAAAMPNVNDTFEETIKLGPCHDERGCVVSPGLPTGPEYTFTYTLTRLPDVSVAPVVSPNP